MSTRDEWLKRQGFNKNNLTYVYFLDDSFEQKEELKRRGFTFNACLYWHTAEVPAGYENKVIPIKLNEVIEIGTVGIGHYYNYARAVVRDKIKNARPKKERTSQWIAGRGDKITDLPVTFTNIYSFQSYYGLTQIVTFVTEEGNILKWFSTADFSGYEKGQKLLLSAIVKENIEDKYLDGEKVTIIARGKLKVL